jgi:hypothetical protein
MSMRMTVMSSKGSQLCSLSLWEEEGSDNHCEFHYFINYFYIIYNNFHCYKIKINEFEYLSLKNHYL